MEDVYSELLFISHWREGHGRSVDGDSRVPQAALQRRPSRENIKAVHQGLNAWVTAVARSGKTTTIL